MSERKRLVVAVGDLYLIIQRMQSAYANDVTQGRAEKIAELYEEAGKLAQPIIDSYPFDYGRGKQ